tara:strand:- start:1096 stop:1317 length:222 start_codon:yes stop_codon:yes gene_type:complete
MIAIDEYLQSIGFKPRGRCACMSKAYRWKRADGHEFKLDKWDRWELIKNGIKRYGKADTAIEEVKEYFAKQMA